MTVKFFLATNASLILASFALALLPCVITIRTGTVRVKAIVALVSFASYAALGLLYAMRKGDMSWDREHHE